MGRRDGFSLLLDPRHWGRDAIYLERIRIVDAGIRVYEGSKAKSAPRTRSNPRNETLRMDPPRCVSTVLSSQVPVQPPAFETLPGMVFTAQEEPAAHVASDIWVKLVIMRSAAQSPALQ